MIPPKYFKVYGERRSGTSYLALLLQRNFTFDYMGPHWTSPLGWKHGVPELQALAADPRRAATAFFFVTRNPYNWVWSMKRYAPHMLHKCALPLPAFFADPWDERDRISEAGLAIEGFAYDNLLDLRYRKLQAAAGIEAQPMHRITRYEDVVSDWSDFLHGCEAEFGLKRRLRDLHDATDRADATRDAEFAGDKRADIDARNAKAAVVEFFGRDNLTALNRLMDWKTEARFGYERIDG